MSALEYLAALERAQAAATPGPWFAWDRGVGWHIAIEDPAPVQHLPGRPEVLPEALRTDLARPEDAAAIVAAHNALPGLTAAVRNVLHRHVDSYDEDTDSCRHCNWTWPCPTVRDVAVALGVDPGAMT